MGREIKRVALTFEWPLRKVWKGFLEPEKFHEDKCPDCENGYSPHAQQLHDLWYGRLPFHPAITGSVPLTAETPYVRAFAERNVVQAPEFYGTGERNIVREASRLARLWNGAWQHHISEQDVKDLIRGGRLHDFTHTFVKGTGWVKKDPPVKPTAAQVNEWSLGAGLFGLTSSDQYVLIKARCKRDGHPVGCPACDGHGSLERYPGQRKEAEKWEQEEPPEGEGWQLWETVSEGSPVSPVFASAEELATWMSDPDTDTDEFSRASSYEAALKFVKSGWAPSFIGTGGVLVSGVEAAGKSLLDGEADTR